MGCREVFTIYEWDGEKTLARVDGPTHVASGAASGRLCQERECGAQISIPSRHRSVAVYIMNVYKNKKIQ